MSGESELLTKRDAHPAEESRPKVHALCLMGVGDHVKEHQILAEIAAQTTVPVKSVSKPLHKNYCFIEFDSEENKSTFEAQLAAGVKIKNKLAKIRPFQGDPSIFGAKRKEKEAAANKRVKPDAAPKPLVAVKQAVVPYAHLSPQEQRKKKFDACFNEFSKAKKSILGKECGKFLLRQGWLKDEDSLSKIVRPIIASDEPAHRNKTEYTISKDAETGRIAIGFVRGRQQLSDFLAVGRDATIPIISPLSNEVTQEIEDLLNRLKEEAGEDRAVLFDAYNNSSREGCFRYLLIRESQTDGNFVAKIVGNFTEESQKERVASALRSWADSRAAKPKAIVLETYNGLSSCIPNDASQETTVYGDDPIIFETVMGVRFRIPFGAFFQVHTRLSEQLYQSIQSFLQIDSNTIFLDICAGTGTMGLILGQKAEKVVFVEMEKASCDQIEANLRLNQELGFLQGFSDHVRIYSERIENCIGKITEEFNGKGLRIVAVVDPPRAGLHLDVVRALRTFRGLDEMVFVSCDFRQGCENLTRLCCEESRNCRGPPFSPLAVQPIDLFPHTEHYETVVHLKRLYE